jgi:hypothetical protein
MLGEVTETFNESIQSPATILGESFGCEEFHVKIFAEEVIRGSAFFCLSMVLKKIERPIREAAKLGDWLVISPGANP